MSNPIPLRRLPSVPVRPSNPGRSVPTTQTILPRPVPRPIHNRYCSVCRLRKHIAAAIALITLTVTTVTLLPSFWGAKYGKDALELARWTARKDYIEACQEVSDSNPGSRSGTYPSLIPFLKYLNRSSINCQRALEGELPPPPGLNEIHVRSLEDLQLKFLNLRIDSPDMGPDHVPLPLHWWLLVGMGFIALLMTGNLARRRRLMQTADTTFGRPTTSLRLDLRAEDIVSMRHAAKNVSEAIASGNDQWNYINGFNNKEILRGIGNQFLPPDKVQEEDEW